jgi:hypothetical protein
MQQVGFPQGVHMRNTLTGRDINNVKGTYHMKPFRLEIFEPWGLDVTMYNLVKDPTAFKACKPRQSL